MAERPILFSAPMVKAILAGWKTQTRRVVNIESPHWHGCTAYAQPEGDLWRLSNDDDDTIALLKPRYRAGDTLWVRETWADVNTESGPAIIYRSDGCLHFCADDAYPVEYERYPGCEFVMWVSDLLNRDQHKEPGYNWRPSIYMPRWASRITLRVTSVRVERVKDITEADAKAEGAEPADCCLAYYHGFGKLWESINGPRGYGWDANPWVWVIEFERLPREGAKT